MKRRTVKKRPLVDRAQSAAKRAVGNWDANDDIRRGWYAFGYLAGHRAARREKAK